MCAIRGALTIASLPRCPAARARIVPYTCSTFNYTCNIESDMQLQTLTSRSARHKSSSHMTHVPLLCIGTLRLKCYSSRFPRMSYYFIYLFTSGLSACTSLYFPLKILFLWQIRAYLYEG